MLGLLCGLLRLQDVYSLLLPSGTLDPAPRRARPVHLGKFGVLLRVACCQAPAFAGSARSEPQPGRAALSIADPTVRDRKLKAVARHIEREHLVDPALVQIAREKELLAGIGTEAVLGVDRAADLARFVVTHHPNDVEGEDGGVGVVEHAGSLVADRLFEGRVDLIRCGVARCRAGKQEAESGSSDRIFHDRTSVSGVIVMR